MRRTKIYPIIFLLALISGFGYNAKADELVSPQLGAAYVKLTDGTRNFSISLSARIDDKRVNITDAPVMVYAVGETGKKLLGTVKTSSTGKAVLNVGPDISLPENKDGNYTFEVQYGGNTKVTSATKTIQVQDVSLTMTFGEKDSVKTVSVKVVTLKGKGANTAIKAVPVEFYIKRLFCLYRFGGEKTDSAGVSTAALPKKMPGDTTGNLVVIARIVENDDYGTVETIQNFKGDNPLIIEPKAKRGLGDTDAPLWMVYTLLVLLSGVWCHVIYVISLVVRINMIGKRARRKLQS